MKIEVTHQEMYEKGYREGYGKAMYEVEQKGLLVEWTPCSESLPEECEEVLCWIERDAWEEESEYPTRKQECDIGWHIDGRWHFDGLAPNTKCFAWMPLPQPYKRGDEA